VSYALFAIGALFVGYALFSKRLSTTIVTAPMLFVAVGVIVGIAGFGIIGEDGTSPSISLLLEATLAIVLFSDATVINSSNWREEASIPVRLLTIGLPLTVAAGFAVAALMFGDLGLWQVALIAAILAPTDAALGQAVISNQRVPQPIRQGLATESGLNDGIALTLVVVFLAGAEETMIGGSPSAILSFLAQELLVAGAIGVGIGWAGGTALVAAARRGWVSPVWLGIGALGIGVAAYGLAVPLGGSGFIAAWLAGLLLGRTTRDKLSNVGEFSETLGTVLTMTSFMLFGAVILGPVLSSITWQVVVYAALSLTVIRMIPVALSMIGSGLQPVSVVFLGWFGPRGLASIVLAGLVVESSGVPGADVIVSVVVITVGISVFAHGATSWIGSQSYANWWERHEAEAPEVMTTTDTTDVNAPHRFRDPGMPEDASGDSPATESPPQGGT
jgi:NhaP-type Na+/H+ or K+/H+ antiporter